MARYAVGRERAVRVDRVVHVPPPPPAPPGCADLDGRCGQVPSRHLPLSKETHFARAIVQTARMAAISKLVLTSS